MSELALILFVSTALATFGFFVAVGLLIKCIEDVNKVNDRWS